jgi:hypothetical protein
MKVKMRLFFSIIILLQLIHGPQVSAQDVYRTTNGRIQIVGILNDSVLTGESNKLLASLNYETAEITLRLDKATIRTGVDSVDVKLKQLNQELLVFKGRLGVNFVKTESHPIQYFSVKGYLSSVSGDDRIIGEGSLTHVFGGVYSCVLNISFTVNIKDINFEIDIPGIGDEVQIKIIQTILEKDSH